MHAVLTALLTFIVVSRESSLLLKMNQDVEGAVELSRDIVAVVITCVDTARVALRTSVVALTEGGSWDLTSTLNLGRELLDTVEAIEDTARGARSDSVRHVEDLSRNLSVSGRVSTCFAC
jgi:hypothetical protein